MTPLDNIPAGTRVDSYYIHFDNETFNVRTYLQGCEQPDGSGFRQVDARGKITFEDPIAMLIFELPTILRSNRILGHSDVRYSGAGMFPSLNIATGCRTDQIEISEDRRTLRLRLNTDIHQDAIRVITVSE